MTPDFLKMAREGCKYCEKQMWPCPNQRHHDRAVSALRKVWNLRGEADRLFESMNSGLRAAIATLDVPTPTEEP